MKRRATSREESVQKNLKARREKTREKAEVNTEVSAEAVTEVSSALTVLPVPLGLSYLLGSLLLVSVIVPHVGPTSADFAKQENSAEIVFPLLAPV